MLDFVRNKQKSIFIKLAFAIIILSFVIGYAMLTSPDGPGGEAGGNAASVNGRGIAYSDFQAAYGSLYQLYQNVYQDQFTPALEKQLKLAEKALDSLIDRALLQEEGERLGFQVSKKELVDAIARIESFQVNGAFNRDRYLQVLAYQRLTPDQFEAMQQSELLVNKVQAQIQAGITVSDADIEEEFRNINEKTNLSFVSIAPSAFEEKVKIEAEPLAAYFQEHQETFRIPDMVSLRYLQFEPQRYLDEVTFDQEELQKFYRRHLDRYEIVERVKASHILVKLDEKADDAAREEKRAFAAKLLEEARAGKDFAELARLNSDDQASAVKGGSLGEFTRGTMVPPFEKAAFAMKPGEISDLVETTFGYHIIKVEEYTEPGIRSFDDALEEVKEGLRGEKAKQLAFEKAMDAYNINRKSGDLAPAAEANQLGLKETGLFSRDGYIDGIGRNAEVIAAAHQLQENELARPVVTEDGVLLFGLKERIASHVPELDAVREMVEAAYRSVEAAKLARTAGEELLAGLVEGKPLAKLAKKEGFKVEETGEFTRTYSPFVPRLGSSEELSQAVFALGAEESVVNQLFEIQNRFVVATVKERTAADMAALDQAKRDELRKTLLSRKQGDALEERLAQLRGEAVIEIYPSLQALLDQEKS